MAESRIQHLLDGLRFGAGHRRVWLLSCLGIMLDGFDFFVMGVAIPLIVAEWSTSPLETGLISSAAILGAILGAAVMGPLSDRIGRRLAFRIDLALFVVFALASALAPGVWWLIAFRFLLGVGIGADYPISASYVSEIAPRRLRERLLIGAFSFQAVGQLLGALVGLLVLTLDPSPDAWRWMLAAGVVPAVVIVILRRGVPESPLWLASTARYEEAARALQVFAGRRVEIEEVLLEDTPFVGTPAEGTRRADTPAGIASAALARGEATALPMPAPVISGVLRPADAPRDIPKRSLLSKPLRRATVLTSVPWFFMDIATYGVGVFTPTIIASIAISSANSDKVVGADIVSTEGAAFLDVFLVIGFVTAILLVRRLGLLTMQVGGFVVMAAGLVVLAFSLLLPQDSALQLGIVFLGFAAFNLFMNAGPNSTTFALPTVAFDTISRGAGAGFAAAAGKAGAAIGVFAFPLLQAAVGLFTTLLLIASGCIVAAVVTFALGRRILRKHSS
ncbi:MFS transporter [Herbiconiux sp. CPCC 203407]|uniref:MFS transporter n=1 Tax=Herbiconiux oxytropis TaxID=2970915 RepID=A0AA41XHG8_9MICO|nr:MFS transporter [Herbiconiux oxytropis]MCS5722641.1 MFS transporter [Herbiconiux oxytropis]MCS5726345.1 MFS transporter [Herbiconiux oxytropis]